MKRLFVLITVFFMLIPVCAQKTMRKVWAEMPDSIQPYLDGNMRQELVDFADMGVKAEVKNKFHGMTVLDSISDRYIGVRLSDASYLQMRILAVDDSTQLICMIKTVCAPEPESDIYFYRPDWKRVGDNYGLPLSRDEETLLSEFVHKPDTMPQDMFDDLRDMVYPVMLDASLSETDDIVTLTLSMPLLTAEEKKDVRAIIKQSKFKWDGRKFKEC